MTIKYTAVPVSARWLALSGAWRDEVTEVVHEPPPASDLKFNFYVNETSIADGALEASIRVSPGGDNSGRLVFRHSPRGCYYAGIGGYGRQFTITRYVDPGFRITGSTALALRGVPEDIRFNVPYEIRVEFVGPRIVLKASGVDVLEATDNYFTEGQVGLETFGNTMARFAGFRAFECAPVSELVRILEDFPYLLKRDYSYLGKELADEGDVQRILWTALRARYSDLVDEDELPKFGLKNYKPDFGIPSLQTIVEVKVVRTAADPKKIQEALMVDSAGYFSTAGAPYRYLVPFVYNKANVPIESAFNDALLSLPNVAAVVVIGGMRAA